MRNYEEYSIEENVSFINEKLNNGISMLMIEKEYYGVGRDTITKKLNRKGYKRSSDGKKLFILVDEKKAVESPIKPKKTISDNNSNHNSNNHNSNITGVMITKEEYKQLLELIGLKEDIKQLLNNNNHNNCNDNNSNNINVIVAEDVSLRQMKIDNKIYKKFREFCNEHKQYKYQDLISSALNEYVDKYSKK